MSRPQKRPKGPGVILGRGCCHLGAEAAKCSTPLPAPFCKGNVRGVGEVLGLRVPQKRPSGEPPLTPPLRPPALQINRPPVKLNLLTCQVRPHAEEKKCFDLVTRECRRSVPSRVRLWVPGDRPRVGIPGCGGCT